MYLHFLGIIAIYSHYFLETEANSLMEINNVYDFFARTSLYFFSCFVSLIILFAAFKASNRGLPETKLFIWMVSSNLAVTIFEACCWFVDGKPGIFFILANYTLNLFSYMLVPVCPYLWVIYIHYQVRHYKRNMHRIAKLLAIPLLISLIFSVLNLFNGAAFYFDDMHFYHRGPWFPLFVSVSFFYLIYGLIIIIKQKKEIDKKHFLPLLLFIFPPLIGGLFQICYYGVALVWPGMTLSLLIVFMFTQHTELNTDYLTGLYNRRKLDNHLENKIASANGFAAIMIDIDNFKNINDSFGHAAGDHLLEKTAQLLRECLRKEDFIARYGGDEFVIIMNSKRKTDLDRTVQRIREAIYNYNHNSNSPYLLSLSLGYDVYDSESDISPHDFFKHIDNLMYKNKKR